MTDDNHVAYLHLYGIPVNHRDAALLAVDLLAGGEPAAVSAADMITNGVAGGLYAVGLNPQECDAILSVLQDPPDGLVELHRELLRDHREPR